MLFRLLVTNCNHRLYEWVMTAAMLGLAVEIAIWPLTIGASAFRYILLIIGPINIGLFFMLAGFCRVIALFANGRWPVVGPKLRALGAGMGAVIWFQMDVALIILIPHNDGIPSPGIPVYFALTVGELISAYRAMTDVGSNRRR